MIYSLIRFFLRLLGRLPDFCREAMAYFLYLIIYYVLRYRVKVVELNLKNSFPDRSTRELKQIKRKYYTHFANLFLEVNALRVFSKKKMLSHLKVVNPELIEAYLKQNRSVILSMGHFGNWEWIVGLPLMIQQKVYAVYQPLNDKLWDKNIHEIRSTFGAIPVPMANVIRKLREHKDSGSACVSVFIADQSPTRSKIAAWIKFLEQPTGVFGGVEKIARKLDHVVVYASIVPVRRGYYELEFKLITDQAEGLDEHEITHRYYAYLEESISKDPEYWLWSHKRWKHKPLEGDTVTE